MAREVFPGCFHYLGLSVRDALDEDISVYFERCATFAATAASQGLFRICNYECTTQKLLSWKNYWYPFKIYAQYVVL